MKKRNAIIFASALLVLAGCAHDEFVGDDPTGRQIVFSANTGYYNGVQTRTDYSGVTTAVESSSYERIDWVDGDLITIYSAQETAGTGSGHSANYKVASHSTGTDKTESLATIKSVDDNGLTWNDTAEHTFYAMYPANTTTGVDATKVGLDGTEFKAFIPESQVVTPATGYVYKPDMNYAYMVATAQAAAGAEVSLEFYPMFTAFQFVIGGGGNGSVDLTGFTLSSSTDKMSGPFVVACSDGTITVGETTNSVSLDITKLTGGKLTVSGENKLTVTLFALPVDMTNLTLSLTGAALGGTRTFKLADNNGYLSFTGRKKYRLVGLSLPEMLDLYGEDILWDVRAFGDDLQWD